MSDPPQSNPRYESFAVAADRVLRTSAGKAFLEGLEWICQYDSQAFQPGDDFNPYAAATRDGARAVLIEARTAASRGAGMRKAAINDPKPPII